MNSSLFIIFRFFFTILLEIYPQRRQEEAVGDKFDTDI